VGWPLSILVACLTGIAASLGAGWIASLAVDWYQISPREGASGYFVVSVAFLGLVAGFIGGLIIARVVAGRPDPGFVKALALSLGLVLLTGSLSAFVARSLADIAPELDGQELMLVVEVRWPKGESPATDNTQGEPYLGLGSVTRSSNTRRAYTRGPLWLEDARERDGRWVAAGAVELFTKRGRRSIDFGAGDSSFAGFMVPLPANPGKPYLEWSRWLPEPPAGSPPWPDDRFSYRFRVQPRSEPVRIETVGPFEVATIASYFYDAQVSGRQVIAASAEFVVRHRGKPVIFEGAPVSGGPATGLERADEVAVIPGPVPALLVHLSDEEHSDYCFLLRDDQGHPRTDFVGPCVGLFAAFLLTNDVVRYRAGAPETAKGRIDRHRFVEPGLYLLGNAVLDTRRIAVKRFTPITDVTPIPSVRPLGISPDERSFLTFGYVDGTAATAALLVTDVVADTAVTVPIDSERMRYPRLDALDPAWVLHHFAWIRGPDGLDRLAEREGFVPIPYQGELSTGSSQRSYRLEPAGPPLREALVRFLVTDFKAERLPADSGAYEYPVRIGSEIVNVAAGSFDYVSVSMAEGGASDRLIAEIAQRFDAALATGKYDGLFGKPHR
jgi:hypothetical protein